MHIFLGWSLSVPRDFLCIGFFGVGVFINVFFFFFFFPPLDFLPMDLFSRWIFLPF